MLGVRIPDFGKPPHGPVRKPLAGHKDVSDVAKSERSKSLSLNSLEGVGEHYKAY